MKIFLDDTRDCPEGFILCKNALEVIKLLATGDVTHISLDFSLGYGDEISWQWLEEFASVFDAESIHHQRFSAKEFISKSIDNLGSLSGGSGETVTVWMKYAAASGLRRVIWRIHSQHPAARKKMMPHLGSAGDWWQKHEESNQFPNMEY